LVLSGEADALENIVPISNLARLGANPALRVVRVPSFTVGYLLFNELDRTDRSRPHVILGDPAVRRALVLGLDRATMIRAGFEDFAETPVGPVPTLSWIRDPKQKPLPYDTLQARALLRDRGWADHDGDGILDREGRPLVLDLNYPTTSAVRKQMALQAQEQWRRLGAKIELVGMEGAAWNDARRRHDFDIDFSSVGLDPSPSGLVQSWSCAGLEGTNVGGYCDPAVDSLFERAIFAARDQAKIWHQAIARLEGDVPAAFVYAPIYAFAVHRRYANVNLRPEGWWSALNEWSVIPGQQLPRDGQ
jgi:peptide/nickel transport system substrate-binding protein